MPNPMLDVQGLGVTYRAITALSGVSLHVEAGEIVSLVGANGAGKSSLLNAISGVVAAQSGAIRFEGVEVRGRKPAEIVRRRIVQVPEGRQVFADLTVLENLELGAYVRGLKAARSELADVFALFPRLAERRTQLAGYLSGGEQQMLAIGRALMAGPRLLLLDEPSMGLAPLVIGEMFRLLGRLNQDRGITILLVEQNARAALGLSHRGYVLTNGVVTATGTGKQLLADPSVQAAFLGRAARPAQPASAGAVPCAS